jgi:ribosome-associated translation inhibitor RaiA
MSDHITRVEVHLTDERGPKNGKNDKRCMMEARLEGRQPIAVTDEAAALDLAVNGAADKLARLIENTLGKLRDERRDDLGLPNRFDVYYGMADSRIGVARLDLPDVSPPEGVADSPEAKV